MIPAAATGMLVALAVSAAAALRGDVGARLVATQVAGVIAVQLTLLLSLLPGVPYYADVAILFAIALVIGGLLFARFLERWL